MSSAWGLFRVARADVPFNGERGRASEPQRAGDDDAFFFRRQEEISARAVRELGSSNTRTAIIETITHALVPAIADLCFVFQRDRAFGSVPVLVSAYPFRREQLDSVEPLNAAAVQIRLGVYRAMSTGLLQRATDPGTTDEEQAEEAHAAEAPIVTREIVSVPLVEAGLCRVVVTLARTGHRAEFQAPDLRLARELCVLAAKRLLSLPDATA